ncbi:MAG: CtsR family transcriptional regulator [Clostridia bacterium]|nr:CtsR family transcriptional regulator [Clostridia bacterium]
MKLSNIIEEFIKEMLSGNREIELQRNELANRFNCVPSQINYVISTRFSPERGYSVESRRGGGGYIKITRTAPENESYILHAVKSIGDSISAASSTAVLGDLYSLGLITHKEAKLIMAALSDNSIILPRPERDIVRAKIFKNILINLI